MSIESPPALRRPLFKVSPSLFAWLAPIAVFVIWKAQPAQYPQLVDKGIPALIALAAILVLSRWPNGCLVALFALMPYQVFIPAWLFAHGLPLGILRPLTSWRELLGLAIALAAIRAAREDKRRFDAIEVVGFAYVIVVAAYALTPTLFAPDAPLDSSIRSLAFRSSAGLVLLLLACRHAPFDEKGRRRVEQALLWTTAVVAAMALWEFLAGDSWNRFVVDTLQVPRYQALVLDSPPFDPTDVRVFVTLGGREFVRVSSVMGSPLALGHFMLLPFGLALERALRGKTRGATLLAVLFGAALLLTQTRSALLGGAVVVVLVLRRAPGRTAAARSRFWLVLAGLLVAAAPFIVSAGLLDRFGGDTGSTTAHQEGFVNGVSVIASTPLGRGLGTSAGVGQRFGTDTTVSENYYLQVGAEVGVIGGALFLGLVVLVNRRLRRARDDTGDALVSGVRSGFLGISIAAFFLHAYTNQTVAWVAFGAAGLALGVHRTADARHHDSRESATMDRTTDDTPIEPRLTGHL